MKIYHPMGSNMMVMVTPGAFHPDVSDWKDELGNALRFDVKFRDGVAEVDDKLGKWMIEHGHAHRTGLRRITNKLIRAVA